MALHAEDSEPHGESLLDKITEKFHDGHDSSSSDDDEKPLAPPPAAGHPLSSPPLSSSPSLPPSVHSKIYRLFGREQPVHKVLGGGKPADVFLWRSKKISASVLGVATVIWFLFELLEYHLLTFICHILIFSLATLFLWSNATTFINKSPPHIPDVHVPEKALLEFASVLRYEINRCLVVVRDIASGKDRKKFIRVIAILWVISVVGSWFNFLTLLYILFVLVHTVPVFYEKYEDQVDAYGEKAMLELKKHYAVFHGKLLSKVSGGPLKGKKAA